MYLSLSLMVCIGLIAAVLESARIQGLKAQMIMGAEAALDSVFAEYDKTLFETYGITLFNEGDGGMEERMTDYLEYVNPSKDTLFSGLTFYPLEAAEAISETSIRAVDYRGSIFAQLVVEYMKYHAVGDQTDKILGQLNILKKGESAREDAEEAKEEAETTDWGQGDGSGNPAVSKKERVSIGEFSIRNISLRNFSPWNLAADSGSGEGSKEEHAGNGAEGFDQDKYEKEWEDSVLHDVEEVKKGGFMKLVLPRGSALSGEKIEKGELPSENIPQGEMLNYQNGLDDMGRELLFNIYLTKYFPSFVEEKKRSGVQYELEYILFGEESDDKNLKASVNRLLLIREGLNIIHILQSPEKMEAALAMATTLMGWTLIPALITLTQAVLVGAWAYGESIMDVRALLGGGKISLIKSSEEWNLSLEGVAGLLQGTVTEAKEGEDGLAYTDYLLLLLFLEGKEERYYRAMDMIQTNMRKSNPDFRMDECIFGAQMGVRARAPGIFSSFTKPLRSGTAQGTHEFYFSVSRMY